MSCTVVCHLLFAFCVVVSVMIFFFKQKTAYEMRISDWSSDVCSSDLPAKLDPETAILVLLTRRMIMCGRNVSWEKPAAGEVEALLATIELPAQDREEILELDWQRAVAPHPQWLQDHREPGYHPDPMDAVDRKSVVEGKSVAGRGDHGGRRK